jgi:RHS repeat-associated protein
MQGRSFSSAAYRFGFNGKEKEADGTADNYDFGARIYDGRLGRWLTVDPIFAGAEFRSTFTYAANSPIFYIDPNGCDILPTTLPPNSIDRVPTSCHDFGNTGHTGNAYYTWNAATNEYDVSVEFQQSFNKYLSNAGENGKSLENENPGITESVKTHEDYHITQGVRAAKNIELKGELTIEGVKKSYSGRLDAILTSVRSDVLALRAENRLAIVQKHKAEIVAKYSDDEVVSNLITGGYPTGCPNLPPSKEEIEEKRNSLIEEEMKNFEQAKMSLYDAETPAIVDKYVQATFNGLKTSFVSGIALQMVKDVGGIALDKAGITKVEEDARVNSAKIMNNAGDKKAAKYQEGATMYSQGKELPCD